MKISITNHTGARNRGCEALVASKIIGIQQHIPEAEFTIHSNDPTYDNWRFSSKAKVVLAYLTKSPDHFQFKSLNKALYKGALVAENLLPTNLLGYATNSISIIKQADLVISSGGDIFTSDYGNIRKHLAYPILAKKQKSYLCSHSIGPLTQKDESYFLKAIENVAAISVRESESYEYLKRLDAQTSLHLTADVAFTLPTLPRSDASALLESLYGLGADKKLVSISISQGIIKYSNLDKHHYYEAFAALIDFITEEGKCAILVPHVMETNPSNNDLIACYEVLKRSRKKESIRILFGEHSAIELKGIIGLTECLVGTRTHATIASLSQHIPTVSIAYSRKAYGIMRDIYGDSASKELTIDAKNISGDSLISAYQLALATQINIDAINKSKNLSEMNFIIARDLLAK
ncbi:polysaccharide pyruvyl transferase family protein [Pseudomonas sp. QL9]|uniref:polysaccharide pyruvyl transferase family protein n=1 Tax=Pseudomonas sp. QL9 TaxID=3242725 RepID=UPI00352AAFF1